MSFRSALEQAGKNFKQRFNVPAQLRALSPYLKQRKEIRSGPKPTPTPLPGQKYIQGTNIQAPIKSDLHPENRKRASTPTPTLTPAPRRGLPTPFSPYKQIISIEGDDGKYEIPQNITRGGKSFGLAQSLMENFDDISQATNAARMLKHPLQMTNLPGEQGRGINLGPNRGENPDFKFRHDVQNNDGTWDRGLNRINSGTFFEMADNFYWGQRMRNQGINTWDDMNDPEKNMRMARLRLEYGNWNIKAQEIKKNPSFSYWYAAPRDLRSR